MVVDVEAMISRYWCFAYYIMPNSFPIPIQSTSFACSLIPNTEPMKTNQPHPRAQSKKVNTSTWTWNEYPLSFCKSEISAPVRVNYYSDRNAHQLDIFCQNMFPTSDHFLSLSLSLYSYPVSGICMVFIETIIREQNIVECSAHVQKQQEQQR